MVCQPVLVFKRLVDICDAEQAKFSQAIAGWNTGQCSTNICLTACTVLSALKYGGFKTGWVNFGAKVRREIFVPAGGS